MTRDIPTALVRHLTEHRAARVADLEKLGFARSTIQRYARAGLLVRRGRGIVGLAADTDPWHSRCAAALLAIDGGVLSHQTAARLLAIPADDGRIHVSAARGAPPRGGEFVLHRTSNLDEQHLRRVRGLRCTSLLRTLFDLATTTSEQHYRWILERQIVAERTALAALVSCFHELSAQGRSGGRRREVALRALLETEPEVSDSVLEDHFIRLMRRAGFTDVRFHFAPPWFDGVQGVVDAAIPSAQLIIELDGRRWHSTRQDFARDRERDRRAVEAGWRVLRFAHGDVVKRPQSVIDSIEATLGPNAPGSSARSGQF